MPSHVWHDYISAHYCQVNCPHLQTHLLLIINCMLHCRGLHYQALKENEKADVHFTFLVCSSAATTSTISAHTRKIPPRTCITYNSTRSKNFLYKIVQRKAFPTKTYLSLTDYLIDFCQHQIKYPDYYTQEILKTHLFFLRKY